MKFRRAFTIVELMAVMAMIGILMAAMGISVKNARKRAKIARAQQETREMTNAILAFEQFAKGRSLDNYKTGSWRECNRSSMKMILGGETGDNGKKVPLLYAANIEYDDILDPWGHAYEYIIEKTDELKSAKELKEATFYHGSYLQNMNRLSDGERGAKAK